MNRIDTRTRLGSHWPSQVALSCACALLLFACDGDNPVEPSDTNGPNVAPRAEILFNSRRDGNNRTRTSNSS